jgi:hypothetical protein
MVRSQVIVHVCCSLCALHASNHYGRVAVPAATHACGFAAGHVSPGSRSVLVNLLSRLAGTNRLAGSTCHAGKPTSMGSSNSADSHLVC